MYLFIYLCRQRCLRCGRLANGRTHFLGTRNSENTISLHLGGLQCTLLSLNTGFSAVLWEAIQIHHINKNHWVTSHSIGQEIMVYDSKFCGGDLSQSLTNQLAIIYSKLQKKARKKFRH